MKIAVYSTKPFEREFLGAANAGAGHELRFLLPPLSPETAPLAEGCAGVCAFVNDRLDAPTLEALAPLGVKLLALRSAGFNHVNLDAAHALGMTVLRVPAYSPYAVAEHAVGLMLTLNRKFHRAFNRVREQNFALDGLMGFDMHGKTAGIVGTGKIGELTGKILAGFGCRVLGFDPVRSPACEALGVQYVGMDELLADSDIISLHCPLNPATRHLINESALARTKRGVMIVNTSRGGVIDTRAAIRYLKNGHIGSLGLDVYEEEGDLFFNDLSETIIQDDVFVRLMTFPNVLITAHQGFFTREAVGNIAQTTIGNITDFERGKVNPANQVTSERHVAR